MARDDQPEWVDDVSNDRSGPGVSSKRAGRPSAAKAATSREAAQRWWDRQWPRTQLSKSFWLLTYGPSRDLDGRPSAPLRDLDEDARLVEKLERGVAAFQRAISDFRGLRENPWADALRRHVDAAAALSELLADTWEREPIRRIRRPPTGPGIKLRDLEARQRLHCVMEWVWLHTRSTPEPDQIVIAEIILEPRSWCRFMRS
jgi:hypothetical protein